MFLRENPNLNSVPKIGRLFWTKDTVIRKGYRKSHAHPDWLLPLATCAHFKSAEAENSDLNRPLSIYWNSVLNKRHHLEALGTNSYKSLYLFPRASRWCLFLWTEILIYRKWPIALFTVSFSHLHYNVIKHVWESISGYFVVLTRNCLASTLHCIVMQMRKTNREKGYCVRNIWRNTGSLPMVWSTSPSQTGYCARSQLCMNSWETKLSFL